MISKLKTLDCGINTKNGSRTSLSELWKCTAQVAYENAQPNVAYGNAANSRREEKMLKLCSFVSWNVQGVLSDFEISSLMLLNDASITNIFSTTTDKDALDALIAFGYMGPITPEAPAPEFPLALVNYNFNRIVYLARCADGAVPDRTKLNTALKKLNKMLLKNVHNLSNLYTETMSNLDWDIETMKLALDLILDVGKMLPKSLDSGGIQFQKAYNAIYRIASMKGEVRSGSLQLLSPQFGQPTAPVAAAQLTCWPTGAVGWPTGAVGWPTCGDSKYSSVCQAYGIEQGNTLMRMLTGTLETSESAMCGMTLLFHSRKLYENSRIGIYGKRTREDLLRKLHS
ncbi:hypothetical protein OROHE_021623 [Orobanche hederae]